MSTQAMPGSGSKSRNRTQPKDLLGPVPWRHDSGEDATEEEPSLDVEECDSPPSYRLPILPVKKRAFLSQDDEDVDSISCLIDPPPKQGSVQSNENDPTIEDLDIEGGYIGRDYDWKSDPDGLAKELYEEELDELPSPPDPKVEGDCEVEYRSIQIADCYEDYIDIDIVCSE
jgi:hypothetical protein